MIGIPSSTKDIFITTLKISYMIMTGISDISPVDKQTGILKVINADVLNISTVDKQIDLLNEQSFGNSLLQSFTNSVLQESLQTSLLRQTQSMIHTQSIQHSQSHSIQHEQSIQNTHSLRGTRFMPNTESDINSNIKCTKKRGWLGQSIYNLRSASLSISMLSKPSDDRNASSFLAGWNVTNLIQGTTILGIPYAVQQGGWAAVAMTFFLGFLTCHTGKLLGECMYETSKKTGIRRRLRITYPEIAEAAMGQKGMISMNIIQNTIMLGGVIMYVILLGAVWSDLLPHIDHLGLKEWAAINCFVSLPTLFVTKLSIVSWFSMFSVFSIMAVFIVLIVFCLTQMPLWEIANIPTFDIETFPVALGIILFSYCAHAVLPGIEGSMKNPTSYNKMMNASFFLASVSKAALGILMVLRFGKTTAEVATVNLNGHPVFSKLVSVLVIANVLFAMPLEMFVVSVSYDDALLKYFTFININSGYHWVWLLISRPLLLNLALLASVIVPHFGLMMGMVGSVTGTALCFFFPCYCHMKLRWDSLSILEIVFDISIMVFGVVSGIIGLYFSMRGLLLT